MKKGIKKGIKKFIFTFPANHPLKNHYQEVFASDSTIAITRMFERYGDYWTFPYSESEWRGIERKLRCLGLPSKRELNPIYCKEVDKQ